MDRKSWIDCVKGIAILTVVLGHILGGLINAQIIGKGNSLATGSIFVIYKFHMPAFLFFSGYCQKQLKISGVKEYGAYILKNLINLGIPYVIFSTVYILINVVISRGSDGVNTVLTMQDLYGIWCNPVAHFWFLYVLFGLKVLTPVFQRINLKVVYAICVLVEIVYHTGLDTMIHVPKMVIYLISYSSFYCLGMLCKDIKAEYMLQKSSIMFAVTGFTVIDLLFVCLFERNMLFWQIIINNQLLAIGLIYIISFVAYRLDLQRLHTMFLRVCGKQSMFIYLLHVFPCVLFRILLLRCGINNAILHISIPMVMCIGCCLLAANIAEHFPVLQLLFYPMKAAALLKKER